MIFKIVWAVSNPPWYAIYGCTVDFIYFSHKMDTEHSLAQNLAHLNMLMLEKEKMQTSNYALQDTISKMK